MKNKLIFLLILIIIAQGIILFRISQREPPKVKPAAGAKIGVPKKIKALPVKIAIVIDDWGYNLNNFDTLSEISQPLTLAILPNLPYSRQISRQAQSVNKEVILHLPMEPYPDENVRLEKDTILSSMGQKQIREILNKDTENLSYAVGVSNHMGSKLTQDEYAIKVIFEELKKRNLFFLDSVTANSVCRKIAKSKGVKFAARSVFLDNRLDEEYIEKQINLLVKKAKARGEAIGIGHDRRQTLKALKTMMGELEKNENIKFVFVSELAK